MADVTKTTLIKVEVEGVAQATQQNAALTKEIDKQEVSIAKLREENKKLTQERNNVNINTEEGKAKLQNLNAQLDKNNKAIKENVDAYTKQKIGVGDYTGALDKLVPGLGATTNGIAGMTKSSLTFLATPIGAGIGAIGIALGALTAYLKGTGEGQDKLNQIMASGKVVMEGVQRVVEFVGKAVFAYIEFCATAWKKVIDFILPSVGKAIDEALAKGDQIAKLEDSIDDMVAEMTLRRAETANKVAKLRAEAIEQEGAQKRATIEEAIKLEEDLAAKEVELAAKRIELFRLEHATKKDLTDEEKQQFAELQAAKIQAETAAHENTLRLRKELQTLDEQDRAAKKEREIIGAAEKRAAMENIAYEETAIEAKKLDEIDLLKGRSIEQDMKRREMAQKKELDAWKKQSAELAKIDRLEQQAKLQALSIGLGQAAGLMEENTLAHKILAAARATIDAYNAFNIALATIPPPFGEIVGATNLALGLANVAKIAGVGFASGGYTGDGKRNEAAGIVHRGEYVVPQHIVKNPVYAGYLSTLESARQRGYQDGGLVMNSATQDANQLAQWGQMMSKMNLWVSWAEGDRIGASVKFKQGLSEI